MFCLFLFISSQVPLCLVKVEGILNGIVSMLALVTGDKRESLILSFCEKLSKAPTTQLGLVCLKVISSKSPPPLCCGARVALVGMSFSQ